MVAVDVPVAATVESGAAAALVEVAEHAAAEELAGVDVGAEAVAAAEEDKK